MSGKRGDLSGKVALLTGGADGIGLSTARLLTARGARVAVVDRDASAAEAAVAELGEERALAVATDVTDREGMRRAVAQVVERFGRLDLVIANAGITPPAVTLRLIDPAEFDKVIAVNLAGVFNTVQPALPALIESRGHIVVVASCAAFSPPLGGAAYMIRKAAVEVLARGFRLELAQHRVGVTTAYFGIVETAMTRAALELDPLGADVERLLPLPLRRRISAEHAARTIVDAAQRRAPIAMAPATWKPLALLRGFIGPRVDRLLIARPAVRSVLERAETRLG